MTVVIVTVVTVTAVIVIVVIASKVIVIVVIVVADGAFGHKIHYVTIFMEILNPEGNLNCVTDSKVTANLLNVLILPLVELYREESAPAACAAGLFNDRIIILPP